MKFSIKHAIFNRICILSSQFEIFEMMKIRLTQLSRLNYSFLLLLFIGVGISSCQTSSSLADGGMVQKRKYQKGYHLNIKDPLAFNKSARSVIETKLEPTASLKTALPQKRVVPKPTVRVPQSKNTEQTTFKPENIRKNQNKPNLVSMDDVAKPFQITSTYTKQDVVITPDPENDYYAEAKRLNTLALLSFIFSILSLFILAIPFGVAAVVCGIIALVQMESAPRVYKGKGFAIVGLIIGIIAVIAGIIIVSAAV